jgi:hypothetical protein
MPFARVNYAASPAAVRLPMPHWVGAQLHSSHPASRKLDAAQSASRDPYPTKKTNVITRTPARSQ